MTVPKRIIKTVSETPNPFGIQDISVNGDINGRKIKMSLVLQVHPLIADYDAKRAYHPTPADWP